MRTIIGFGHRKRRGKDAAAEYLIKNHGFRRLAFADLLKQMLAIPTGWDARHAYGDLKEVVDPFWGFTPRWLYQFVGTNLFRKKIDNDFWVKALEIVLRHLPHDAHVVLTDVRFPNEADMIKRVGGVVVKIERNEPKTRWARIKFWLRDILLEHKSETALRSYKKWDFTIQNDSNLEELYKHVEELIKHVEEHVEELYKHGDDDALVACTFDSLRQRRKGR